MQLLKAGAQVHHVSKDGRSTALHEAVLRNHADLTDLLLRASANPFLENGAGERLAACTSSVGIMHLPNQWLNMQGMSIHYAACCFQPHLLLWQIEFKIVHNQLASGTENASALINSKKALLIPGMLCRADPC